MAVHYKYIRVTDGPILMATIQRKREEKIEMRIRRRKNKRSERETSESTARYCEVNGLCFVYCAVCARKEERKGYVNILDSGSE